MNKLSSVLIIVLAVILWNSCTPTSRELNGGRALDPWVMRLNLDERPQMIALALNKALFAAYDPQIAGLYKVWKGDILLTGPVFDNIHGRQPETRGEAYIEEPAQSPWSIQTANGVEAVTPRFKSYRRNGDQVTIHYELKLRGGDIAQIKETPDFIVNKEGRPGLERRFEVSNLPEGTDLLLTTSFLHLQGEQDLVHDGEWVNQNFSSEQYDWGESVKGNGQLKLNAKGSTVIQSYFEPKATAHIVIESDNESEEAAPSPINEEEPLDENDIVALANHGMEIIGQNDCAACHQMEKKIIGPSYTMVAQKYEANLETVNQLSQKVINGGSGVWGQQPMSPHPHVSEIDARAMAAYILSVVPDNEDARKPGVAVDFYDVGQPLASLPEIVPGQSPNASEVYPSVDFRSGNPDIGRDTDENFSGFVKDFVMEVNGFLNMPQSKTYQLQFVANNGGKLAINGELVSEGHFYEGTYTEEFEVPLKEGANPFKINFYHHLFDKYLMLMWREHEGEEYQPIPAEYFTHNAFDIKPTADGIKSLVSNKAPGFGASLEAVHPAFDLSAVRPEGFEPRVGDLEFRENGNLVLCTWDGEVFEMENPTSSNPGEMKVTRIADGLCEPLGITEVDGALYVLQRWELTKLVDLDDDGTTDEYVSIATFGSNAQFHEWTFGLIYRDGYFYGATGIAMGGGSENMHVDRGKVLKIAMDGSYSHVAYGVKEPNGIGFGPDDEIFVTDNEGEWQPVCKIYHIPAEGKPFYGNKSVEADHLPEDIKEDPPVIWLPQNEIGNSPSQPILMHHGPYEGQMIHGEITHGGIKRDFIEKVKGQYQGAVFRFAQGLEVGINRLEWGPDEALYAAGLGGAQDYGHQGHTFGLQRLTYNGKVPFEMLAIRAKANGLEIEFTKPLRVGDGITPSDYQVQQWHYYWDGEGTSQQKRDLENLAIRSVSVSEDRTRAFLELGGMKKEHVLYVQLQPTFLSESNEQLWSNEGWYTLNEFPDERGEVKPYPYLAQANRLTPPEVDQGWQSLFDGSTANGWDAPSGWNIAQGHLQGDGGNAVLLTEKAYTNFELEMEWKVEKGAEGGLLYKINDSDDASTAITTALRFQLVDDQGNADAKEILTRQSGAHYDIVAPQYLVTKTAGDYNHLRLVVQDNSVEHWINGIRVVAYEIGSNAWSSKVSGSVYSTVANFGQTPSGKIGLYSKDGNIWVRNIRIKDLDNAHLASR